MRKKDLIWENEFNLLPFKIDPGGEK